LKVKVTNHGKATRVFYDAKNKAVSVDGGESLVVDLKEDKVKTFQKRYGAKSGFIEVEVLENKPEPKKTDDESERTPTTTRVRVNESVDEIPEDWRDLSFSEQQALAQKFTSDRVTSRKKAAEVIEAEIANRG
jgi:hypothetical protein